MRAFIYDALQLAGLGLFSAGAWALGGAGWAMLAAGGALLVVPMLELHLARRAG